MKSYKIVYCTPSLYLPGGVERVLTTKANYFAEVLGYDIYIILTDGKGKQPYYPLSKEVNIVQLDINFEILWSLSFLKKIPAYLRKQRLYKKRLTKVLFEIKPDITISLLRREINFITNIKDGSKKIGELHVNRNNYRNFEKNDNSIIKGLFAKLWMKDLVRHLKRLDKFVVLTEEDKKNWKELNNVICIPNPITSVSVKRSSLENKKVIAVGRYVYQKGFDLLLQAWEKVNNKHSDWYLNIYGGGERDEYIQIAKNLNISKSCHINGPIANINDKYAESSIFVLSSRFEGFGMVIIEAMTCGVPSVSFGCPCGPRDIINDGVNGFLVENGNVKQLAEKICILIENEKLRRKMGEQCCIDSNEYNIENLAEKWAKLFESI